MLQVALEAPLGHSGLTSTVLDSFELSEPPAPAAVRRIISLGGRRQRAAFLQSLSPPARARAEAGGGADGERRRVLRGLGSVGLDRKVGTGRLDSAGRCARREAVARAGAPRLLPVQDRAGTGASGGDVTFLAGISSRPVDRCESPLHTNCVRVVAPHRRAGVPGRPGGGVCSAAVQPRWVFYTCIVH